MFSGNYSTYTITANTDGTDTLTSIEKLVFDDETVTLSSTATVANDFDGDGKTDILWQNTTSGDYAVWTMNGTTMLSSAVLSNNPGTSWSAVA